LIARDPAGVVDNGHVGLIRLTFYEPVEDFVGPFRFRGRDGDVATLECDRGVLTIRPSAMPLEEKALSIFLLLSVSDQVPVKPAPLNLTFKVTVYCFPLVPTVLPVHSQLPPRGDSFPLTLAFSTMVPGLDAGGVGDCRGPSAVKVTEDTRTAIVRAHRIERSVVTVIGSS